MIGPNRQVAGQVKVACRDDASGDSQYAQRLIREGQIILFNLLAGCVLRPPLVEAYSERLSRRQ